MARNATFVLLLLLWWGDQPAWALDARIVGTAVQIDDDGSRFTVENLIPETAFLSTIHAIQKRGGDYFLLFGFRVASRPQGPGMGYCGAGAEVIMEGVTVRDSKVIKQHETMYSSCLRNRYGYIRPWHDGKFQWQGEWTMDDMFMSFVWTYDSAHPEEGIKEEVSASKK